MDSKYPDHLVHDIVDCCFDDQDLFSLVCKFKTIITLTYYTNATRREMCSYHTTLQLYQVLLQNPC